MKNKDFLSTNILPLDVLIIVSYLGRKAKGIFFNHVINFFNYGLEPKEEELSNCIMHSAWIVFMKNNGRIKKSDERHEEKD